MSRVLITYSSKEGSTRTLAEAVAEGARHAGAEVVVLSAPKTTHEDLLASDAIIAGSPVYFGGMSADMKSLWDRTITIREKLSNKVGAAFVTAGHTAGGRDTAILSILQAMLIHEMIVVGDPILHGGHYGVSALNSPSLKELAAARALGERVSVLSERLLDKNR